MTVDPSAASWPTMAVRFMLDADPAPGLLSRLLQPFAKRDLVPDRMWAHRAGEMMHVEIAMEAMPGEMVHLVEGNLRQVVGVRCIAQLRPEAERQAA
jgi:acetolactate synthase regulatory subunit